MYYYFYLFPFICPQLHLPIYLPFSDLHQFSVEVQAFVFSPGVVLSLPMAGTGGSAAFLLFYFMYGV